MAEDQAQTPEKVQEQPQEPDYKALYEQAQADVDKWKALSRKNEARAKAAAEDRSSNAEIAALQDELAAIKHERQRDLWVSQAIKDNGLDIKDAPLIIADNEVDVVAKAQALKARLDSAPKFSPYKDSGESKKSEKTPEQEFAEFMKGM